VVSEGRMYSPISGQRACTLIVSLEAVSNQLKSCQFGPIHGQPGRQPCNQILTLWITLPVRLKLVVPSSLYKPPGQWQPSPIPS